MYGLRLPSDRGFVVGSGTETHVSPALLRWQIYSEMIWLWESLNMSSWLMEPYRLHYSPLAIGILLALFTYLGLALFRVPGLLVPGWVWLAVLLVPLSGLVLQFATRRVVYIRAYQLTAVGLVALVYGSLLWAVFTYDQPYKFKLFAGLVMGAMLVALGVGAYRVNQKRPYLAEMPYGPVGILDNKTGLVDPAVSPPLIQRSRDKAEKQYALLWRLAPLTAGLSMLLVRGLPASGKAVLVAIIALVIAAGYAGVTGSVYFYIIASWRWEQQHSKRMYVKR